MLKLIDNYFSKKFNCSFSDNQKVAKMSLDDSILDLLIKLLCGMEEALAEPENEVTSPLHLQADVFQDTK